MKRPHLTYTPSEPVLEATRTFMAAKPWRTENAFFSTGDEPGLAQTWAGAVTSAYGVAPVTVIQAAFADEYTPAVEAESPAEDMEDEDGCGDADEPTGARIHIAARSMIRLFRLMGKHLLTTRAIASGLSLGDPTEGRAEEDWKWATSLFYQANPKMYRARVRDRRINVDPYGIYTSATEQLLKDYDVDPCASNALTLLHEAQQAALVDVEDENEDASVDDSPEETEPVVTVNGDCANHDQLRAMNTRQLRVYATQQGLTGTWSMNKAQLLEALGVPAEVR